MKKKLIIAGKFLVSISLILLIIFNIDWAQTLSNFSRANYFLLSTAFILNIFERIILTHKWNILIKARGINVSLGRMFLINSIGTFWGLFLPSSLGTDVVRGYYLVKNNSEKSISITSVFLDRILAMFSLLLLGIAAVLLSGDLLAKYNLNFYFISLTIGTVLFLYAFQRKDSIVFLKKHFRGRFFDKLTNLFIKLHYSVSEYKKHKLTLVISFLFNLLVQITRVLTFYVISLAFAINIPIIYFVIFIPIVMIVLLLPISIGGLGLNEGTFVAFFLLIGISINDSVVISFTNTFINTINTLLGGIAFFIFSKANVDSYTLNNHRSA